MAVSSGRAAASAALLLLLLLTTELGTTTVAGAGERTCKSQSHNFKGECTSTTNCASVCKTEGFPDGKCKSHYFVRKCFCIKDC
ncbi:defensin Tm-AMP-D1.2-like [Lolium rigidum]|uniref:defensin Tm-AMP-D1.2-like n=1 Tax=Lolium rigidum TaxID=89674 RepID=UPI001F5D4294|nr:defensin Tm-AMP-D1.2-like [Lolium rigidum]